MICRVCTQPTGRTSDSQWGPTVISAGFCPSDSPVLSVHQRSCSKHSTCKKTGNPFLSRPGQLADHRQIPAGDWNSLTIRPFPVLAPRTPCELKKYLTLLQTIEFTGAPTDSRSARTYLLEDGFQFLQSEVNDLRARPTMHVCLGLSGHMPTCAYVMPLARLHLWPSQQWLRSM